MSSSPPAIKGAQAAQDAAAAWKDVRADESIQFTPTPLQVNEATGAPVPDISPPPLPASPAQAPTPVEIPVPQASPLPPPPAPKPPPEPSQLGDWLRSIFEPIGKALGLAWPVMQWILIGLAAALVLYGLYRLIQPWIERRRVVLPAGEGPTAEPGWSPERAEAEALLDEADVLAAAGRFGEAAHLLLQRSVDQIARARPEWIQPATTTREISAIPALPGPARGAFLLIAQRVERSLFALRALDQDDWLAARAAYADFALQDLPQDRAA